MARLGYGRRHPPLGAGLHPRAADAAGHHPPPTREKPFSTPRSWHCVSDALLAFGDDVPPEQLDALLFGCLTREHVLGFKSFLKQIRNRFSVHKILKGEESWPAAPQDRDLAFFLTQSLRDTLVKELPAQEAESGRHGKELAVSARAALKALARIDAELAQLVLTENDAGERVPDWFVLDIARELPRLLEQKAKHGAT